MGPGLNSDLIRLDSRHTDSRAILMTHFFEKGSLTEPEACPFGYLAGQQVPGICHLCSPARRLKVHTSVSGFYVGSGDPSFMHVWQTLGHLPSPAETKTQDSNLHALYMILSLQRNSEIQMRVGSWPSAVPAAMPT